MTHREKLLVQEKAAWPCFWVYFVLDGVEKVPAPTHHEAIILAQAKRIEAMKSPGIVAKVERIDGAEQILVAIGHPPYAGSTLPQKGKV